MNKGDFIKWTSTDEEGAFSHVGRVLEVTDTNVTFETKMCVMTVPLTDGTFESAKAFKIDTPVAQPTAPKQKAKATKTGTKLERAVVIYRQMKDATRKELIEAFVKQLDMTPAGASTYAAQVRKLG